SAHSAAAGWLCCAALQQVQPLDRRGMERHRVARARVEPEYLLPIPFELAPHRRVLLVQEQLLPSASSKRKTRRIVNLDRTRRGPERDDAARKEVVPAHPSDLLRKRRGEEREIQLKIREPLDRHRSELEKLALPKRASCRAPNPAD